MMKKRVMRVIALLAATTTMLTACGSGNTVSNDSTEKGNANNAEATVSDYPDYLNLESAYPIIKDEYADEITLTMAIRMQSDAGEWEDLWICQYLKEKYNINLEVEYLYNDTIAERKSLMFASNELPDIMINMLVTTDEIVKYGVEEGLFLKCDEYMNETLTPNILKYFTGDTKAASTAQDGYVYSLPQIKELKDDVDSYPRVFINTAWLEELGLELPKTLDEFVDAMYAIKEADPAGVGSDKLYPFGGGMDSNNLSWYLLNAFGYNQNGSGYSAYGIEPTLRDGEVVLPVYDMEIFQEYLKLMNQFYNDGIIAPTYFTIDSTEVDAQVLNGQTAMYNNTVYVLGQDNQEDWASCTPLTSNWQKEPEIPAASSVGIGTFLISADTEYPELCLRLADAFYNNETDMSAAFYGGYGTDSEYSFGYLQREYIAETNGLAVPSEQLPEGMTSWNYIVKYLNGNTWPVGTLMTAEAMEKLAASWGADYTLEQRRTGDNYWRGTMFDNLIAYAAESYPTTYYASAEVNQEIADLEAVLQPYVKEQVALFITGQRSLSEVDAFVKELEGLDIDRLLELYIDIYSDYTK